MKKIIAAAVIALFLAGTMNAQDSKNKNNEAKAINKEKSETAKQDGPNNENAHRINAERKEMQEKRKGMHHGKHHKKNKHVEKPDEIKPADKPTGVIDPKTPNQPKPVKPGTKGTTETKPATNPSTTTGGRGLTK